MVHTKRDLEKAIELAESKVEAFTWAHKRAQGLASEENLRALNQRKKNWETILKLLKVEWSLS
jgi:hypothetical protein